jgi:hypothetical protein
MTANRGSLVIALRAGQGEREPLGQIWSSCEQPEGTDRGQNCHHAAADEVPHGDEPKQEREVQDGEQHETDLHAKGQSAVPSERSALQGSDLVLYGVLAVSVDLGPDDSLTRRSEVDLASGRGFPPVGGT